MRDLASNHQRRAAGRSLPSLSRCRLAPLERPSGHSGPRTFPANYPARRFGQRDGWLWKPRRKTGFDVVKINAVAVKGLTEPDVISLVRFGRENGIEVRFIEFMPLDAQHLWSLDRVLTADEMIAMLEREFGPLVAVPDADPRAPATEYRFADGYQSRIHRLREPAVLHELQSPAPHLRWQDALLPIRQ